MGKENLSERVNRGKRSSLIENNQMANPPWYSEEVGFFGPGYIREYSEILTPQITLAEIDFLEKVLKLNQGMKILDCPCGYGRHSIELARRGYNVTGVDLNEFFLKEAKKVAKQMKVSVRLIKGDMREIFFENEFDVALNLFTSFGYFENDEENQKVLNAASKSLKRGGKFVLDIINRDYIIRNYREKDWKQLSDGSIVLTERYFDHIAGRNIEKRIRIWKNGKREEFIISLRMYTVAELVAMFHKAGLVLKEIYGNYAGGRFTFDSERCILITEKK